MTATHPRTLAAALATAVALAAGAADARAGVDPPGGPVGSAPTTCEACGVGLPAGGTSDAGSTSDVGTPDVGAGPITEADPVVTEPVKTNPVTVPTTPLHDPADDPEDTPPPPPPPPPPPLEAKLSVIHMGEPQLPEGGLTEGNCSPTTAIVYFRLDRPMPYPVEIHWETMSVGKNPAGQGVDYDAGSGTIVFAPGQTLASVEVVIFGDTTPEPTETLAVYARPITPGVDLGPHSSAFIAIEDNDANPVPGGCSDPRIGRLGATAETQASRFAPSDQPIKTAGALTAAFRRVTHSGAARLALRCPAGSGGCSGRVRLRLRSEALLVGTAPFALADGTSAELSVPLSRTARRALRRRGRLQLTGIIVVGGKVTTTAITARSH